MSETLGGQQALLKLESMAHSASKLWQHHHNNYASSTRPLWHIIKDVCKTAYILGRADADYEAGRALDTLDAQRTQAQTEFGFASWADRRFELIVRDRESFEETTLKGQLESGQFEKIGKILPTCVFVDVEPQRTPCCCEKLRTTLEKLDDLSWQHQPECNHCLFDDDNVDCSCGIRKQYRQFAAILKPARAQPCSCQRTPASAGSEDSDAELDHLLSLAKQAQNVGSSLAAKDVVEEVVRLVPNILAALRRSRVQSQTKADRLERLSNQLYTALREHKPIPEELQDFGLAQEVMAILDQRAFLQRENAKLKNDLECVRELRKLDQQQKK